MPSFDFRPVWNEEWTSSETLEEETGVVEIMGEVADDLEAEENDLPNELPILPVRGMVIYPLTQIPVTVGQPRSTRLVEDAVVTESRTIGIVTSQDPEVEEPGPDQLYRVGTVVSLRHLRKSPDGTILLFVQGLERIRIEEFTDRKSVV